MENPNNEKVLRKCSKCNKKLRNNCKLEICTKCRFLNSSYKICNKCNIHNAGNSKDICSICAKSSISAKRENKLCMICKKQSCKAEVCFKCKFYINRLKEHIFNIEEKEKFVGDLIAKCQDVIINDKKPVEDEEVNHLIENGKITNPIIIKL